MQFQFNLIVRASDHKSDVKGESSAEYIEGIMSITDKIEGDEVLRENISFVDIRHMGGTEPAHSDHK